MMKINMSSRELLVYYFSGVLDDYLDYLDKLNNPTNGYRIDTIRFINDVKNQLDPFKKKLTPDLLDMYVQHYKERVAMGEFYNVIAPTKVITALNKELNGIVKNIERPNRPQIDE